MGAGPLVSVTIPSFNAERTLPLCLEGIGHQSYRNLEIILVDSYSTDRTREIAEDFGARVVLCEGKLLAARFLGLRESRGDFIVFVDTDQVLEATAIERALGLMETYDMLLFEEHSYNPRGFIPRLYQASKEIINRKLRSSPSALKPGEGFGAARFFKRYLLERAFEAIPSEIIPQVIHYDHDIIYYECYRISQRVGLLPNAVYHIEPDWRKLWRTNFRYGASLRYLRQQQFYRELIQKGESRLWFDRHILQGLQALLLMFILKMVQRLGWWFGEQQTRSSSLSSPSLRRGWGWR